MAENIKTILIESILGGQGPSNYFSRQDQFLASCGIDPGLPVNDSSLAFNVIGPSGLLRPASSVKLSSTDNANPPMWMVDEPKGARAYVYDSAGSTFILDMGAIPSITAISDAGEMTGGAGNGAAYYDNYIYFAKATTVARYGPLDSATKTFNGNYWTTTLGKTALTNPVYPATIGAGSVRLPNHVLHRHSDGKLYIADVVDNQATIHYIRTTKTTVEGDTDSSSTYGALTIGRSLYPTAMETYGQNLVIALMEGFASGTSTSILAPSGRAKIAFWDTVSQSFNQIIFKEFPDPLITAMKNINGVLYVVSGNPSVPGFRLSRFVGGYTWEEVAYSPLASPSLAGAIDGDSKRLLFGVYATSPTPCASVLSWGLQEAALSKGLFNVLRTTAPSVFAGVTTLLINKSQSFMSQQPFVGWSNGDTSDSTDNGIDKPIPNVSGNYNGAAQIWWSQLYKVGKPFRIKNIRLPFCQAIAANMTLDVTVYVDDASTSYTGASSGLPTINNTSLPNSERIAKFKPVNVEGYQNFYIGLQWSGSALLTVGLPIEIDVEVLDDQD